MCEAPDRVTYPTAAEAALQLSEKQLFELATGESVEVEFPDRGGTTTLRLTVEPPTPCFGGD